MGYNDSSFNAGISFGDSFLKGDGLEQYQYFTGEEQCPASMSLSEGWWEMEHNHLKLKPEPPFVVPFVVFLRNFIADRSTGDAAWELEMEGNKWLDRYLNVVPKI